MHCASVFAVIPLTVVLAAASASGASAADAPTQEYHENVAVTRSLKVYGEGAPDGDLSLVLPSLSSPSDVCGRGAKTPLEHPFGDEPLAADIGPDDEVGHQRGWRFANASGTNTAVAD